jgi:hypothetical protein
MGTAVLNLPRELCTPTEIGSLGAFFDTSASQDKIVRSKEIRLISALVSQLDEYLLAVISAQSAAKFEEIRAEAWPKYARGLRALQDVMSNLVSESAVEAVYKGAIKSIEQDLYANGESLFGKTLTEQAVFTLWTLGEIRSLRREIMAVDADPAKRQEDVKLFQEYHVNSLWAQFHLDSLMAADKFKRPVPEAIRGEICDGLRAVVNAYAIMKSALRLRMSKTEESAPANLPWDEEDDRLLESSLRDIDADFSADS